MLVDINKSFEEINACLKIVAATLEIEPTQDDSTEQALYNLCKSIDGFRRTAKLLYDFVSDKTKKSLMSAQNDPFKTPPRLEELATPSDFGQWNTNMSQLNIVLQKCSEILPASLCLTKKKLNATNKRKATQNDIMISFIDIMVLLARMNFNIADEDTHHEAYEYLASAEQMCSQVKFMEGYRWLSGSYYNLGATMIKTELYSSAIYPLRKSCSLLEKDTERMNTDEGRLQISKRYEILGTCCQKNERFEDAIKAYRFALKRVPVSAIEKFASRADSVAVSTIIETDPLVPKLIDRFLRASIIDPDQSDIHFASEFMDLSTLTPVQQCAIYECELKVWTFLSLKLNVTKFQSSIIEKLLEVYTIDQYPIRRARILLLRVRMERSSYSDKNNGTRAALNYAKEAIQCLNVQVYSKDSNLLNYRRHYLALAYSWVAICGRELNVEVPNTFSSTLQQWGILLKRITPIYHSGGSSKADIQHVYHSIDDIEHFYDHLRMLSDLFGVTGQYIYQICALRLLLKLNNGLRDVSADSVSDSIIITCTIARIYCDLGYTGKAETEFKYVQNAISSRPCSNTAEIVYRINYSSYLTLLGDYDMSKEVFEATKITWEHTPHEDSKNEYVTAKAYIAQCMLLADAYATKSQLLANTSTLDNAITCAMASLRLLNKCAAVVQKTQAERTEKPKAASTELENPFMPAPKSTKPQEDANKAVFRESQWVMAQKMATCFVRIASLYMKKGSWNEVGYFLKQGPLLAEKVNSNVIFFNSYLCSSEFNLRFGNPTQSKDNLEEAIVYQPAGKNHLLDEVELKMAMANLAVAKEYYNEAITTYDEVNEILQQVSQPAYILSIEQLVDIKEDTPRDTKVMFDDEVDKNNKQDCVPLYQLQSENIVRKAIALSYVGKVVKSLALLEKLKETEVVNENEVQLDASIVDIKLSMLRQEIANRADTKILLHESMVLPVMKTKAERGGKAASSTVMKYELRMIRDNLTSSLERIVSAYHAGYSRERPTVIQSVCSQATFTLFLQNQLSNTSILVNNSALLTTYYMEMAKGLSMRRDMQSCLQIKMRKILPGQSPSDKQWPLTEEEQEEQADRFAYMNANPEWLQAHLNSLSSMYREEDDLDEGEFQERFVDILPTNWTVCSLTLDPVNQELYAVRMRTKELPFVVKIPLNRSFHRLNAHAVIAYSDAVTELQEIVDGSDETIRNSQSCHEQGQIEAWWNTRKDLDGRLKKLLDSIENQWFSGFKGILSGRHHESKDQLSKFQKGLNELVFKMISAISPIRKQVELSVNFCRMALCLGRRPTFRDLEDLSYFILSCYDAQGAQVDYGKLDIKKMTDQMKALIVRYHERSNTSGVDTIKNIPNDHVILILDKHLQMFPFESTPILQPQAVSRLPCLSFLRDRILYARSYGSRHAFDDFGMVDTEWKDISVSRKNAFYVLNPSGDLIDTQKEFEPLFKSVPEWNGVTQTMPMELQCKEALLSRDVYMYFGHSAGQSFMRGTTVRQLPKCAVSLLMGCSSGLLESNGEFEPYGYVLNYLLAGSPAVVANLWDVTDRSIDKLTKHMLYSWGMLKKNGAVVGKPKSLVQAVTESRPQGKLSYLIGAATVVYGIPVYIDQ
ncbi:hypothetical protein HPULCUR_004860 [Helicostylum pulchrum]|uniref:separase n=1 Tax=Helicostylum pulchrum TaxID=562976 RepID=A0ABP9XYP9_9FUNG